MVNINAVELIDRFLKEKKIKHMKRWTSRNTRFARYSAYVYLKEKIRSLFNVISGDDIVGMLKGFN